MRNHSAGDLNKVCPASVGSQISAEDRQISTAQGPGWDVGLWAKAQDQQEGRLLPGDSGHEIRV